VIEPLRCSDIRGGDVADNPFLAAIGDRKAGGIAETIGRAVNDLGYLGQGEDCSRADTRNQQKFGEILRAGFRILENVLDSNSHP
jgi:hypothetical protein